MDRSDRDAWRPMGFGRRRTRDIEQPLIEPLWEGLRVLVHWDRPTGARIVEAGGVDVTDRFREVAAALGTAIDADTAVLDGYLTIQATRSGEGTAINVVEAPTAGQMMGQMVLGASGERALGASSGDLSAGHDRPDVVAFVAVDLLEVDGTDLLDVPLLERRRQLDSVMTEVDLARRGLYVRPPVHSWFISWRSIGFRRIAAKAQNGRYRPGTEADDWAIADIPRR
jgi:ATP-dependent DNA ligase